MNWLNYHHLLYFWTVAREGGLAPAGKKLRISLSTLSAQLHALEDRLGEKLMVKQGRRLVLTEFGRIAYRYAEDIFTLGQEMLETLEGHGTGQPRLTVGVVDVVPKLIVRRLLQPALDLPLPARLICVEDNYEKLLADLGLHTLDAVVSDAPVPPGSATRAHHHLLGESGVTFFATDALAAKLAPGFPRSLDGQPWLLPVDAMTLRRSLNFWFARKEIRPRVVGEFQDSALMKVFGGDGAGVFAGPTAIEDEIREQYRVNVVGRAPEVRERFYVITVERKLTNPALLTILKNARNDVFP